MSKSRTYRSAYLTEEIRENIRRHERHSRLECDVLPVLRDFVRGQIDRHTTIDRQLSEATSASALRDLVPQLDNSGLAFDMAQLHAELASVERVASELGLELPDVVEARAAIEAVATTIEGHDDAVIEAAFRVARDHVGRLDAVVHEERVERECQVQVTHAVVGVLVDKGYRVGDIVTTDDGSVVVATRPEGTEAFVDVDARGFGIDFTDPRDAVTTHHPAADELCESAVIEALDFHRRIRARRDLALGPVQAAERPTRGSASATAPHPRRTVRGSAQISRRSEP